MPDITQKKFQNDICQKCIKKNFKKYGKFDCNCDGITVEEDVKLAMSEGLTESEARWLFDPVYFFETIYGSKVRWYQKRILYCTSRRLTGRQCRQTGKTLMFMYKIFHQIITNENISVLIVAPTEKQIAETWNKYIFKHFIYKSNEIKSSVVSSAKSPAYEIAFDNGSRITLSIANESVRGWCLPAGEMITMADGSQKPIEEVQENDIVISINDETLLLENDRVFRKISNGKRDIFEFITESGRELRATGNHPILTNRGWVETNFLTEDDYIAIPKSLPFGKNKIDKDEISFIAYMIGDGTCTEHPRFTNINPIIINDFKNILNNLNIPFSISVDKRKQNYVSNFNISRSKQYNAIKLLNRYNLNGKTANNKSIHKDILESDKEVLSLFIRKLYSTDGWTSSYFDKKRKKYQIDIGYTTTSYQLANDIQLILHKFGIQSVIRERDYSKKYNTWQKQYYITIRDSFNIKKFFAEIGFIFGKEEQCKKVLSIAQNTNENNYLPIRQVVIEEMKKANIKPFHIRKKTGWQHHLGKENIKISLLKEINKIIKSQTLDKIINGDIYFDKIKDINFIDHAETYNLTIEKNQTFIANGIITHNTGSILYIDEAALVPTEALNSIIMTIASAGNEAYIYYTSTPKGRGNTFYNVCKDSPETNEFHVSIYEVEEMQSQISSFKKLLGETGFIQECEAEFPDASGGPFNYKGIDLAKSDYEYENCHKEPGWIYFGGVDWNGPNIGTYFVIAGFNPEEYRIKIVDYQVISSAVWNSTVAKQKFIELNRKWNPKHWMCDYGFGHCLDPNTNITTIDGIKKLKDIQIGDLVLTHNNSFKQVTNKFTPKIEKKTYTIVPANNEAIIASEDHRFLIKRLKNRFKSKDEEILTSPEWIKAKDIDKDIDFVAVPKTLKNNNNTKILDLYMFLKDEIPNLECDSDNIWIPNSYSKLKGFSLSELAIKGKTSKSTITRIRRKYFNKTFNYTEFEKGVINLTGDEIFKESPIIKVNRYIDILDKDFLNFIGFFIAEGNLSHKGIEITQYELGLEKSNFFKKIESFSKILSLEYSIYKTEIDENNLGIVKRTNNKYKYRCFFFGEIINKLMLKLTGRICDKKRIHNEIFFSNGDLTELVAGICSGDGHTYICENGARVNSITTTSPDIAYQVRDILISSGILPSLKSYDHEIYKKQYIVSYIDQKCDTSRHNRTYIDSEKYLYVPIVKMEYKEVTQDLLDITVEGDHSFIANGVITHNSIVEELKYWSTYKLPLGTPGNHPDAMLKHTIESVEFGGWVIVKDPFTKEEIRKTTRAFMVSQVSRLFEVENNYVPISFPKSHIELIESLENYKLLQITDRGVEKYGFDTKSGIEDHCYTPGHEILTIDGWKKIEDITINDKVAAPDRFGNLRYENPSRIINKDYNGDILVVSNRTLSYKITDKHRLTFISNANYRKEKYEIEADILDNAPWKLQTPAAILNFKSEEYQMSDDEIYLLGMFLSEGCTNINHHHYRTIWDQKKEPQVTKIRNAISKVYPGIFRESINKRTGVKRFEIQKMEIYNKYKKYGKCDKKFVDREYLNNFSKRQLEILLNALMDGDGHWAKRGGSHYDTTSLQLANDVQEICCKLGIQTTLQCLKNPDNKPHWKPRYRIGIKRGKPFHSFDKGYIKKEKYTGSVHCVTVSTGLLVVRHNGKVHIGSNCQDAFNLSIYGIVKHYNELFNQIFLIQSVPLDARTIMSPNIDLDVTTIPHGSNIVLITDNSPEIIELDERKLKDPFRDEKQSIPIIARTFNKNIQTRSAPFKKRDTFIVRRSLDI